MIKLSIIVPIYNVAPYLRKCVDSLLAQDYDNYEIILVDDGSTDDSPQICDEYAASPLSAKGTSPFSEADHSIAPIRVVHRENGGLSAARNSGIEVAKGEYIMFVDSDDYLQQNVLGALIEQMESQQLDVLRYNYYNVHEDGSIFEPHKNAKPYFDYSSEVVDGDTFLNERLGYACYSVMFIIRRELLKGCIFTPGIYFEDTDWTPRMLLKAKRVASTEMIVYNYLWREGSITLPENPQKKKKVLEDKIRLLHGFKEQQQMVQNKQWFIWQTAGTTMSILGILATYPNEVRKPYLQQIKALGVFPLSSYRAVGNNKYKIRLANISPSIYCKLMHIIRK